MERIALTAAQIDANFDAMLYDGMPEWLLIQIEEQRRAAHDDFMRQAITAATGSGFRRL